LDYLYMFVDAEKRSQSLAYLKEANLGPSAIEYDELPTDPTEISLLIDHLKPRHFAELAIVTGQLVDEVVKVPLSSRYSTDSLITMNGPFGELRRLALGSFNDGIEQVKDSPAFLQAAEYTKLIGELDPNRFIDLELQLYAGIDTATSTMLTLLRQLPKIISHHTHETPTTQADVTKIARRSVSLPWQLAMMSVEQMMAAQDMLTDDKRSRSWGSQYVVLDPDKFKPTWKDNEIVSIQFDDLGGLNIPTGYSPLDFMEPLEESIRLSEYSIQQISTVGCPITLLPQRVNGLWGWFIEGVEEKNLWAQQQDGS
jgi:hypothetical protein